MFKKNVQGWMKHWDFILLDLLSLEIAFLLAYMTRMGWGQVYIDERYAELAVMLAFVDFAVLIVHETMKNVLYREFTKEFTQTLKHVFFVEALMMLYLFALKSSAQYSRIVLVSFALYYLVLSVVIRLGWRQYLRTSKLGMAKTALYIITTDNRAEEVVGRYLSDKAVHYLVTGICLLDKDGTGSEIRGIPVNTTESSVLEFLCREWVDEVVVSVPYSHAYPDDVVDALVEMGIVVHIEMERPTRLEWQRQEVKKIAGARVVTLGLSMASPLQFACKRVMDILGGLVGCLLTLILAVIIGPIIYIKSPGPIFFSQTRVGKNGKQFKMYKFRSMYLDAEKRKAELMAQNRVGSGLMFKLDYDPRIIGCEKRPDGTIKKGIGNFIRDYSLDEFPQFWNCLKGDISLVGTRPPTV
ncbi:MAG: sugar transferase, partial [Oscillospiraceae bacterium]|nr:sugar transferase [Oscillospiraceae bacterium]